MKRLLSSLFFASLSFSCQPEIATPVLFEICGDELDNDDDGLTDCEDANICGDEPECQEQCNDNIDNDLDGFFDCSDDDCAVTSECLCSDTIVILPDQFPVIFEGDTADGVDAINAFGCQTGDSLELAFPMSFPGTISVDILVEPLDGVPMVLQHSNECQGSGFGCVQDGNVSRFPVSNQSPLFFVGAREAGQTGRFRITFSLPQ